MHIKIKVSSFRSSIAQKSKKNLKKRIVKKMWKYLDYFLLLTASPTPIRATTTTAPAIT